MADNLFAGLTANDYAAFSRDFDSRMERELALADFAAWKQDFDNKLGSYLSRRVVQVKQSDEYYVVDYQARFEQADQVKVTVVFHSGAPASINMLGFDSEQFSWSAYQQKR